MNSLGTMGVLTGLAQANTLSTIRAFECTPDPTHGMAIECARRRERPENRRQITRLCTSQRVIRFPVPQRPGLTAHFKLFSLLSAGRDVGSYEFEVATLREHIGVYLSYLTGLTAIGFRFEDIVVELSDTKAISWLCSKYGIDREAIRRSVKVYDPGSSNRLLAQYRTVWPAGDLSSLDLPQHSAIHLRRLEKEVCASLAAEHGNVRIGFNMHRLNGLSYYEGPCFHIVSSNHRAERFSIADGGLVNWTQRMLLDAKERLMTSALGIELLCRMFRLPQS